MEDEQGKEKVQKVDHRKDMQKLPNYLAVIAIVPALLSVLAYELVTFTIHVLFRPAAYYNPVDGIAILVPMALMTELFTWFLSRSLLKRMTKLTDGMKAVARGDFSVKLKAEKLGPFHDAAQDFNTMVQELQSVQMLRSDFINNFSHEFKTPITSINGFSRLLLETEVSEEERQEYLKIIAEESGRLSVLANETIEMSRLDHQSIVPDQADYALDEQLRQEIILLSNEWNAKKIDMEVDLVPVTYHGNAGLMAHVWINLLNNAVKFTPEGGRITVRMLTEEKPRVVKVMISDTGAGMTPEVQARIFDRYYQGDSSHSGKGLGLGLAIAHRITELAEQSK